MKFDWSDFFTLAKMLQANADILQNEAGQSSEACLRTAISRAYYACFNSTKDLAAQTSPRYPRVGLDNHKQFWEHFQTMDVVLLQKVGVYGDRLRSARHKADYQPHISRLSSETEKAVRYADMIFDILNKF